MRIDTPSSRRHLKPRKEPYWQRIAAGQYVGFRVLDAGVGTWSARWRGHVAERRGIANVTRALRDIPGTADFDTAAKAAREWFAQCDGGIAVKALTVKDACDRHVAAFKAQGQIAKAEENARRFERLVYGTTLSGILLHRLRPADVEDWRNALAAVPALVTRSKKGEKVTRPRSEATVNRDIAPLRAALNRAHDDSLVGSDIAWRAKLKPTKGAGRRRDVYIDRVERAALIEKADEAIKPFLHALAALPLRPGAVAALTVADFDRRLGILRIGKDKAGADRRIKLPPGAAALFADAARSKLPGARLFARPDGVPWNKDTWWQPIHDAAVAAKLPPATSAYALRHSTITDLVVSGLDLLTVAQISGTSVAMIEAHYGHLRQDHAAAALATLAL